MTNPIAPSPKLVQQWLSQFYGDGVSTAAGEMALDLAARAAAWGADTELDACCKWVGAIDGKYRLRLRLARRPKPPSLKEQAQAELKRLIALIPTEGAIAMAEPIRRALDQLPDS